MRAAFVLSLLIGSGCSLILGSGDGGDDGGVDRPPDAGALDASTDFEPCLSQTIFSDDFAEGERDMFWGLIAGSDGGISQGAEGLRVNPDSNILRGYTSVGTVNTADRSVTVAIDPMLVADGAFAQLAVLDTESVRNRITTVFSTAIELRNSPETYAETVGRDPATDVYYRLRFSDSRYFHETSPDGRMFRTLYEVDELDVGRNSGILIGAATPALDLGNVVFFRDFSVAGRPPTGWCAASTLVDNFVAPEISSLWNPVSRGGGVVSTDGELSLIVAAGQAGLAGVESSGRYNLADTPLRVELGPVDSSVEAATVVEVRDSSLTFARFRIANSMISAEAGSSSSSSIVFDEALHSILIFEANGSDLTLLTAPSDGGNPVTMLGVTNFDHLLSVEVLIYIEAGVPVTSEARSSITGVNL